MNCWFRGNCEQEIGGCERQCICFITMQSLMQSAQLPKNKQAILRLVPDLVDVDAFNTLKEIQKDVENFVKHGGSLYIYSPYFGNGKTSWAIKIMQAYFNAIWVGNGFKVRGLFVNVPNFLSRLKANISCPDPEIMKINRQITEVDLVIFDDIGSDFLSGYDHSVLLSIIDQREVNGLANIYTGNLGEEQMINVLGGRLASRVWNTSTVVQLMGADARGGKA